MVVLEATWEAAVATSPALAVASTTAAPLPTCPASAPTVTTPRKLKDGNLEVKKVGSHTVTNNVEGRLVPLNPLWSAAHPHPCLVQELHTILLLQTLTRAGPTHMSLLHQAVSTRGGAWSQEAEAWPWSASGVLTAPPDPL